MTIMRLCCDPGQVDCRILGQGAAHNLFHAPLDKKKGMSRVDATSFLERSSNTTPLTPQQTLDDTRRLKHAPPKHGPLRERSGIAASSTA